MMALWPDIPERRAQDCASAPPEAAVSTPRLCFRRIAAAVLAGALPLLAPTATAAADGAPDLYAGPWGALTGPSGGVGAGSSFQYDPNVQNFGNATSAATTVRFYVSTDETFGGADMVAATTQLASVEPGGYVGAGLFSWAFR